MERHLLSKVMNIISLLHIYETNLPWIVWIILRPIAIPGIVLLIFWTSASANDLEDVVVDGPDSQHHRVLQHQVEVVGGDSAQRIADYDDGGGGIQARLD